MNAKQAESMVVPLVLYYDVRNDFWRIL